MEIFYDTNEFGPIMECSTDRFPGRSPSQFSQHRFINHPGVIPVCRAFFFKITSCKQFQIEHVPVISIGSHKMHTKILIGFLRVERQTGSKPKIPWNTRSG